MQQCESHIEIVSTLARIEERLIAVDKRINGSIDDIKHHIENSRSRNLAIVLTFISAFLTIFFTYGNAKQEYGKLEQQVEVNTGRWEKVIKDSGVK